MNDRAEAACRRGVCLVVAAPSGAGKSTIARALRALEPSLANSVSVTTRPRRPGERDGEHYRFLDEARFRAMADGGELVEWAEVFGRFYGTPRAPVLQALASGRDMIFDIDWQGHRQLRAALPGDVVGVFVLPPRLEALAERLRARGQDDEREIARRMALAAAECAHWPEFDHLIVNAKLDRAVAEMRAVLAASRLASTRQQAVARAVLADEPGVAGPQSGVDPRARA